MLYINKCTCPQCDEHLIVSFIMASIHAHGLFVPFTLSLQDDGHVVSYNNCLG